MVIDNSVIRDICVEYFVELLNEEGTQAVTCDDTDNVEVQEPTFEESKQIVRENRNYKAPK